MKQGLRCFYQHSFCLVCVRVPYDILLGLFMLQKQLQTITSYVTYMYWWSWTCI